MMYREIIVVCSQIHTKHISTLCGQNVEFLNVQPGGKYSDHWGLYGQTKGQYIYSLFFPISYTEELTGT